MKRLILLITFTYLSFIQLKAQTWSQVPGYQIAYNDVLGVTRHQGNIWVLTRSGIYKVTGSSWQLTSSNFTVSSSNGCIYSDGTDLYTGSLFSFGTYQALVLKWDGLQWVPIGYTGSTESGVWIATLSKTPSGNLCAGGFFNNIGSTQGSLSNIRFLVVFDGSIWTQPYAFTDLSCASGVYSVQPIGDSSYVAGLFPEINNIWTPSTFRFKEGAAMSALDGYGFCELATGFCLFQNNIYAGGTRQHDNVNVLTGLVKRVGNTWNSVSSTMQLTNTRIVKIFNRLFVAGVSNNGLNGVKTNVVSYDGTSFTNEGAAISHPNQSGIYPAVHTVFADTIGGVLYVSGNFMQSDGNIADGFARLMFSVVPVRLSLFTASLATNKNILLNWRDETPEDGVKFQVQMSTDGRNFRTVGQFTEQGSRKDYSFTYPSTDCGKLYFRLAFEGKYSETRTVNIPCDVIITSDRQSLRIETKYPGTITILNSSGQTIARTVLASGYSQVPLSVPGGIYIARFTDTKGNSYNQKILVQ